jgi:lactoylglutathione lyase
MAKFLHTMIRVLDADRSIAFYRDAFGLVESHRMEFPTFALIYLRDPESGTEIELTWNHGQSEAYSHGSGYGHVAFCVDDLAGHQALLKRLGYPAGEIKEFAAAGNKAHFYFTADPDGYKIEVLQREGHYT